MIPNETLNLNFTSTDLNLDSCWYEYNNSNTSVSCVNGTQNNLQFNYQKDKNSLTIYTNDTYGNLQTYQTNWDYNVFENSRTFPLTTYQTKSETYSVDVTSDSQLTAVNLDLNGTQYPLTQSGENWTKNLDIPSIFQGNYSVKYIFTYNSNNFNSTTSYQTINPTVFTLCNSTYTNKFLNLSFKDESTFNYINASIPTSTFVYYIGSGTQTKTYTFINNSVNPNYEFCGSPNVPFTITSYIQFKNGIDYPQRIYEQSKTTYSSTITNKVLYLLNSLNGIYTTFHVSNFIGTPIIDVSVIGTRIIDGNTVTVSQGKTGSAGTVTFWVDPDFPHIFTFSKTGYDLYVFSLTPTNSAYTVTLSGGNTTVVNDYSKGISMGIEPSQTNLLNGTLHNFNYTIASSYWSLDKFGFDLKYSNGTDIGSVSSTSGTGGTVSLNALTGQNGSITMDYYYEINGTFLNGTNHWNAYQENSFSISYFITQFTGDIDNNLLGVQGNDNGYFFKALFSIFFLISITGILSLRYGIASQPAIGGIIFGALLFLNSIGMIPTPAGTSFKDLGTFIVAIVGLILIVSIFKEESR